MRLFGNAVVRVRVVTVLLVLAVLGVLANIASAVHVDLWESKDEWSDEEGVDDQ